MKHDERGYIVAETIWCFVLFVFLNLSILSLINIVAVQARVHYALTQAAEAISMYSYTLEAIGAADHLTASAARGEKAAKEMNTAAGNINDIISAIESLDASAFKTAAENSYNHVSGFAKSAKDDPRDVLQNFMNYGLNKAESWALDQMIKPLINRYLTNGSMDGDTFLKRFRVKDGINGLHFYTANTITIDGHRLKTGTGDDSMLLDSGENLKLIVQYDIDYTFGTLPLPFTQLHVTQEVKTKAWLNGTGKGYVPK